MKNLIFISLLIFSVISCSDKDLNKSESNTEFKAEMVLSKDNITQHVWDYDADILPNTVEVYVGYLRNKLDKPFKKSPNLINTKRGFGYVFGKI